MDDSVFPRHYDAWKNCITHKCKIPLTKVFVNERIRVLSDVKSSGYKSFVDAFGPHWTKTVLGYLNEALRDPNIK